MTELATRVEQPQAMQPAPVNVGEIISRIPPAELAAASTAIIALVNLQNQQTDRWAKEEWWRAFARVKAKAKTIQAEKPVPRKEKINGHETGKMITAFWTVPLNDLLDELEPLCQPEGLDISFDSKRDGNIVTGYCIVAGHGHSESRSFAKNIANAQGADPDVGAVTTCQRKSLMLMFAIRSEHMEPDDPRLLGELITPSEAQELQERLDALAVGADPKKHQWYVGKLMEFLQEAGVIPANFSEVYSSALPRAQRALAQAEAKRKLPSPPVGASAPSAAPTAQTTGAGVGGPGQPRHAGTALGSTASQPPATAQTTGASGGGVGRPNGPLSAGNTADLMRANDGNQPPPSPDAPANPSPPPTPGAAGPNMAAPVGMVDEDGMFHCPCGKTHLRGAIDGVDTYKCLECGRFFKVRGVAELRTHPVSMGVKEGEAAAGGGTAPYVSKPTPSPVVKCPKCKATVPAGNDCANCGEALNENEPTASEAAAIAFSEGDLARLNAYMKLLNPSTVEAAKRAEKCANYSAATETIKRRVVCRAKVFELDGIPKQYRSAT